MNKVLILPSIILFLWFGAEKTSRGADNQYLKYVQVDSAYVYKWHVADSAWILSQVQLYHYTEGRLSELLTKDFTMGYNVTLTAYAYDEAVRLESATNYIYGDDWIPSTRELHEYNALGKTGSVRVQKWSGTDWVEDRLQQNYEYDAENKLIGYESIYWRRNAWTLPTVSVLLYNERGELESRIATRPDGNIDYRIIYEYDTSGRQTQFYTQYPAGSGWSNWNLRSFQYNTCGGKLSQIQYAGQGPYWVPSTKTEFFTSFNTDIFPGRKVPVCHNGHTIWVAAEAVPAHLKHGDCIGECSEEKDKSGVISERPPFSVYPNPARESVTVRFDDECICEGGRVDLTDRAGNLVKSYRIRDNSLLVIERGNLKAGQYYVRLGGKTVYSLPVIFE